MVPQEEPRSASEDTEESEPGSANSVAGNGSDNPSDSEGSDAPAENGGSAPEADGTVTVGAGVPDDASPSDLEVTTDQADEADEDTGEDGADDGTDNEETPEEDEAMAVDGELVDVDEDVDKAGDSRDESVTDQAGGAGDGADSDAEALGAAVLDLTSEVTNAEAAFLAAQPEQDDTDGVDLDLSEGDDTGSEGDSTRALEILALDSVPDMGGEAWTPDPVLNPAPPLVGVGLPATGLPAEDPAPKSERPRLRRRMRARKVRRIIRYIDPWSVLKFSMLFYSAVFVILMIAGVLLWSAAVSSGTVDNLEDFIKDLLALESFTFEPDQIFRASALAGAILVVASTAGTVLLAILFNLISDLIGGIRVTVVELETSRAPAASAPAATVVPPAPDPSSEEYE
ncbi:MAG: hypothetical protein GY698_05255 [Actinomycetia bacterium]|nr:hypothetical protein [Actinomycetes bacterium]